jgi:GntR family histidine utilization transcriptional repressor
LKGEPIPPLDGERLVERRTWNRAIPVTLGRFWCPGGDHGLEGRFRAS